MEGRNFGAEDGDDTHASSEKHGLSHSLPSSPSPSPWCHHRADVRLTNFKVHMKKKIVLDASLSGDEARPQPTPPRLRGEGGGRKEGGEVHPVIASPLQSPKNTKNEEDSFCSSDSREEGAGATTPGLSGSPGAVGSSSNLNRLPRKTCSLPVDGDSAGGEEGGGRARHKDETAPSGCQGQERENDAEMTIGADLLEILVPSPPPLPRPPTPPPRSSHNVGSGDAQCRDGAAEKNTHEDTFLDEFHLARETLLPIPAVTASTAASRTLGTAIPHSSSGGQRRNTWARMAGKGGGGGGDHGSNERPLEGDSHRQRNTENIGRNEAEEERRGSSGPAGGRGIEADCVEDTKEDGCRVPMTRIIAINSFRFQRSLEWYLPSHKRQQQPQQQQPSSPECSNQGRTEGGYQKYPDDDDGITGVDEKMAETTADEREKAGGGVSTHPKRYSFSRRRRPLWSQMGIEIRAGHIAASLPPRFQLGDLQVAAILQWKGIQEALGES